MSANPPVDPRPRAASVLVSSALFCAPRRRRPARSKTAKTKVADQARRQVGRHAKGDRPACAL